MKEEILSLNALRFLAALLVLSVHLFTYLVSIEYLPQSLSFLGPYTQYGYLGVNLFFLISGFVISLSSEGRTFGQFFSARFIRLFPVFWICVSITTLFVSLLSDRHISLFQYLANLTMVPSLYGNYSFIDGSYWTLLVELKFYLAVAVLILLRTYIPISLAKVALCLTIPVVYFAFYFNPYHISFIEHKSLTVLHYFGSEYAQYFIAGILFYELYKKRASIFTYVALALCYVVAVLIALDRAYDSNSPEIIFLYITSFFGIFLAISLRRITNASFTFLGTRYRKILTTLGALTYPIYLLHNVLSHAIIEALIQHHVPTYIASPLFFVTLLLLIFLVNMFDIQIRTLWKKIL